MPDYLDLVRIRSHSELDFIKRGFFQKWLLILLK